MEFTTLKLAESSTPFSTSTDEQIVGELDMQKEILKAKLIIILDEEQSKK